MRRYRRRNPLRSLSTGETVALAVVGVAVIGGIGYYLYQQNQAQQAAAAGGGTISGGQQTTTLGPGGSTTPLGPAALATSSAYAPGYSASNPPPEGTYEGELG
jgi:hypothetical protein